VNFQYWHRHCYNGVSYAFFSSFTPFCSHDTECGEGFKWEWEPESNSLRMLVFFPPFSLFYLLTYFSNVMLASRRLKPSERVSLLYSSTTLVRNLWLQYIEDMYFCSVWSSFQWGWTRFEQRVGTLGKSSAVFPCSLYK